MTPLSDQVYRELKRRLTLWEYVPGSRLAEDTVAQGFDVSRTPVRDALRRLEREGFLEHQPWSGYRVRIPDLGRIEELYEIRLALEETGVRRLACASSLEAIAELLQAWDDPSEATAEPDADLVYADEHFHETLAGLSGNMSLYELIRSVNEHIRIIRVNDFLDPQRVADTYRQHREVLGAILRRDPDASAYLLRAHILESQSYVRVAAARALERAYSRRPTAWAAVQA
ncbi:MAG: GntR family transcriptional regulator [Actinomycetota bacterium]